MAADASIRTPSSKPKPQRRLGGLLAPGATVLNGVYYVVVPCYGLQKLVARIKVSGNNGTIDIVFVGPDFQQDQALGAAAAAAGYNAAIGTKYTSGNPTQVAVTAGTEAIITATCNGEHYALIKYTQLVGVGAIVYCDVAGLALST